MEPVKTTVSFSDLERKKVLVTGALGGLGKAIACALAIQGAHVIVGYRTRPQVAEQLCAQLRSLGASGADALGFDVSRYSEVQEALEGYVKVHGPITKIVNNAGVSHDSLLVRIREADIHSTIDTNLKGALYTMRALSRGLLKAREGAIVNISSVVALMGNPGQVAYSAAKAGLIGMTKSVAKELGGRGIRCNAICPGFIATDMTAELAFKEKEVYLSRIPLGRFGQPHEVSKLVLFLLSEASHYITGEVIKIDGGLYI